MTGERAMPIPSRIGSPTSIGTPTPVFTPEKGASRINKNKQILEKHFNNTKTLFNIYGGDPR
jgi:hypothetical protein